jgi:hypothetical protein
MQSKYPSETGYLEGFEPKQISYHDISNLRDRGFEIIAEIF